MQRFGRAQKIKKRNEISQLLREGQRWVSVGYTLIYQQNNLQHDRFGVIVSRKLGNAVNRNKIKRMFREVYRCNIKHTPPFFDILIKPRIGIDFWNVNEQRGFFNQWQERVKIDTSIEK